MIDLYIKQAKGISTRVSGKDFKFMKTKNDDFVILVYNEIILPINKNTLEFEKCIAEPLLTNCIECIIYENGNLSYIYKLNLDMGKTIWDSTSQMLHCPEALLSFHQHSYKELKPSDL